MTLLRGGGAATASSSANDATTANFPLIGTSSVGLMGRIRTDSRPGGEVLTVGLPQRPVLDRASPVHKDRRGYYAEIVYASGGRAFRISADDIESLGFSSDGRRAELRASADLWDITRILRPVRVGSGLTLQVALSESGRGTIAFSLWDGDTLVYDQPEKALAGGFVTIR